MPESCFADRTLRIRACQVNTLSAGSAIGRGVPSVRESVKKRVTSHAGSRRTRRTRRTRRDIALTKRTDRHVQSSRNLDDRSNLPLVAISVTGSSNCRVIIFEIRPWKYDSVDKSAQISAPLENRIPALNFRHRFAIFYILCMFSGVSFLSVYRIQ